MDLSGPGIDVKLKEKKEKQKLGVFLEYSGVFYFQNGIFKIN
jgi:hypothetical protein